MKRRVEVEQGRVGIEGERLGDCDLINYSNEYDTSPLWHGGCLLKGLDPGVKTRWLLFECVCYNQSPK